MTTATCTGKVVSSFFLFMAVTSDDLDVEDAKKVAAYYKRADRAWRNFINAARENNLPFSEYVGVIDCAHFEECLNAALDRSCDDPPAHMLPIL